MPQCTVAAFQCDGMPSQPPAGNCKGGPGIGKTVKGKGEWQAKSQKSVATK